MALGIGYGLPFVAQHGTNPYKTQWAAAREGAKGAGATVEDENAGTGSCLVSRGQDVYTDGLPFTPSLLIVPQFYKAGNLYQDVPPFVAEDSTMRFTVSRNTTATRVNSSGLIESVASGVPRIDWLGQSCPGLLVEASGQNLAFHSESWVSGNNWGFLGATNATGAIAAPNGTITANALSPTAVNTAHIMTGNSSTAVSYTSGTIYTQSAFFKAGTGAAGQLVQLTFTSAAFTQGGYANFDLSAGTVLVVSGSSADANRAAKIENYGNGWYRCIFTATCNLTGTGVSLIPVLITASGSGRLPSFTGVTGDILYGWGAQVEAGSVATTYIPTTTTTASRSADVISASGALVSGLIGQTEGTMYAEVDFRNLGYNGTVLTVQTDNWTTNSIQIQKSLGNQWRFTIWAAGSVILNIDAGTITAGIYKVALAYNTATSGTVLAVNGSIVSTQTASSIPACNSVVLGARNATGTFTLHINDRIRAAALYTTRLSNDHLAELTRL